MSSLSSLPLAVSDSFHLRPRRTQTFLIRKELSEVNYFRLPQRCFTVASTDYASVKQPNLTKPSPPIMPPFPYTPPPYIGPTTDEIIAMRKEYLSPAMIPFYENPLNLVNGKRQYLFDENGKRYVDAFAISAAAPCGHCHPVVEEALFKQVKLLQHNNVIYLNHTITDYAKALAEKMPGNLKVFYFFNSGTEANELAILMARLYTGRNDIISLRNAYHGLATSAMGTNGLYTEKFDVVQTGFQHALNPDPYRGPFGSDGEKYAEDVQNIINYGTPGKVAGFIAESIQGVGGIVELAPGYLPAVYKSIKKAGGLCIADEAIIGFGRTGSNYWGFENHDVVPDIVTMAKGIGNGAPLSAVVTTPEIAQVLTRHSYYSTFAGNPASTAAALAVLKVIDQENLQRNANDVGSHLKERLTSLKNKHEIIGDVRGKGFMLGVEFVTDRKQKTPAIAETKIIFEKMKELGVLVGKGGLYGNVFRITPPLCFTKPDSDYLVDVLDYILSTIM